MKAVIAAAVVACVAAAPTRPVFSPAYTAQLKVQAQQAGGPLQVATTTAYWSLITNQTAYVAPSNGEESDYYDWNGNDVYSWTVGGECNYWCDISDLEQCNAADTLCAYDYLHSAVFNGTTTYNGIPCNSYTWNESLVGVVMNSLTLLVDQATNSKPVMMYRVLTPFGNYDGWEQTDFLTFTPGQPPASAWNVPGENYCQEGDDGTCQAFSEVKRVAKLTGRIPTLARMMMRPAAAKKALRAGK